MTQAQITKITPADTVFRGLEMIHQAYSLLPDPARIALWGRLLSKTPEKDFRLAVSKILMNKPTLPGGKNGNVAALILDTIREMTTLSSEEAWGEVTKNISRVGYYGTPEWSSDAIKKAVDALGWKEICLTLTKDHGVLRAHFFRIYDSVLGREVTDMVGSFSVEPRMQALLSGIKTTPPQLKRGDPK